MTKLEKEAEEYAKKAWNYEYNEFLEDSWQTRGEISIEDFIAGAKSNYVKRKVIKGKLNLLKNFYYGEDLKDEDILEFYQSIYNIIEKDLKEQLKEPTRKLTKKSTESFKKDKMKRFLEECASSGRYVAGYYDDIISQKDTCKIDDFFLNSDIVGKRKTKKLLKDNYGL